MSWVEKNQKIDWGGRGGGDYSGLENSGTMFLLNDQSSKILEKSFKSFRTVKQ